MDERTISATTPTGTGYTAGATTPLKGLGPARMRFEVEAPAEGVSFVATYGEGQDASMSVGKVKALGRRVGLKATDEARARVAESERPVREARAAQTRTKGGA